MTHLLVIYDISNDRIRGKVAMACQDYGLDRVQYSAFYGQLSHNHQEMLMLRIRSLLGESPGRIQLIPIGQQEWSKRIEIEVVVEEEMEDEDDPDA